MTREGRVGNVNRLVALVAVIGGAVEFARSPNCGSESFTCPGYAFTDPWILRGERGLLALVGLLLVTTVVAKMCVEARWPLRRNGYSAGWNDQTADEVATVVDALVSVTAALGESIDHNAAQLVGYVETMDSYLKILAARVARLETANPKRRKRKATRRRHKRSRRAAARSTTARKALRRFGRRTTMVGADVTTLLDEIEVGALTIRENRRR
jgi:hypothetical protein